MAVIGDVIAVLRAQVGSWVGGMRQAQASALSVDAAVRRLAVQLGAGFGLVKAGQFVLQTAKTFEELENRLQGATQSADEARRAFAFLQNLAGGTPFALEDLTKAFIQLRLLGIGPTREMMDDLGNIAAATGHTMEDLAGAVQSAGLGSTRALREFGIAAKADGAAITLTFQGVSRTVRNDSATIIAALQDISKENFAGAMEADMQNLTAIWNKFRDVLQQVARALGRALIPELKNVMVQLTALGNRISSNANVVTAWAKVWIDAGNLIILVVAAIIRAAFNLGQMIGNVFNLVAEGLDHIGDKTGTLEVLQKFFKAMAKDAKDVKDAVEAVAKAFKILVEDAEKANEAVGGSVTPAAEEVEAFSAKVNDLKIKMEDVADAIGRLFEGLFDGWRGLLDAIKQIIKELVVAVAKAMILKALLPSKAGQQAEGGGGSVLGSILKLGAQVGLALATQGASVPVQVGTGAVFAGAAMPSTSGGGIILAGPPTAPRDPMSAARDAEWMHFLGESIRNYQAGGGRLG